jgi:hypothetical protein
MNASESLKEQAAEALRKACSEWSGLERRRLIDEAVRLNALARRATAPERARTRP